MNHWNQGKKEKKRNEKCWKHRRVEYSSNIDNDRPKHSQCILLYKEESFKDDYKKNHEFL